VSDVFFLTSSKNTTEVFLHTSRTSSVLWHVFHRSALPLLRKKCSLLHSALVQVRSTRLAHSITDSEDTKNPRSLKVAARDLSTNLRLLAWVCCPLIGSSLRLDV